MKRIRIIGSVLSLIALLLCAWSIFAFTGDDADYLGISLNFIYFFTLLIAFLCFRISLSYSNGINWIVTLLAIAVIFSSTYIWIDPFKLLISGKITLGLIPLLVGTTLMLIVKADTKWSKIVQLFLAVIAVAIASCVFLGVNSPLFFTIALIGMSLSSIAVVIYLLSSSSARTK